MNSIHFFLGQKTAQGETRTIFQVTKKTDVNTYQELVKVVGFDKEQFQASARLHKPKLELYDLKRDNVIINYRVSSKRGGELIEAAFTSGRAKNFMNIIMEELGVLV